MVQLQFLLKTFLDIPVLSFPMEIPLSFPPDIGLGSVRGRGTDKDSIASDALKPNNPINVTLNSTSLWEWKHRHRANPL